MRKIQKLKNITVSYFMTALYNIALEIETG